MNICYSITFETEDASFFILESLVYTWCTCDICLFSAVIRGCHWSDMLFNTATNLIRNWTQELLVTILEIYQHNYCYLPISNVLLYFSLILKPDALPTLHATSTHTAETSTDDPIPSTVSALRSTPSAGFMNCRICHNQFKIRMLYHGLRCQSHVRHDCSDFWNIIATTLCTVSQVAHSIQLLHEQWRRRGLAGRSSSYLIHLDDAAVVFCEKGHLTAVHWCKAHLSEQERYS